MPSTKPQAKHRLKHDTSIKDYIVPEPGVLYTTGELAVIFKTTKNSVNVRRHNGRLPIEVVRDGSRCLFKGEAILDYLAKNTDPAGGTRPQSPRLPSPGRPRKQRRAA